MLRVSVLVPYISIVKPCGAWSLYRDAFQSCSLWGITLITAHVSTKNCDFISPMHKKGSLVYFYQGGSVAPTRRLFSFPKLVLVLYLQGAEQCLALVPNLWW